MTTIIDILKQSLAEKQLGKSLYATDLILRQNGIELGADYKLPKAPPFTLTDYTPKGKGAYNEVQPSTPDETDTAIEYRDEIGGTHGKGPGYNDEADFDD